MSIRPSQRTEATIEPKLNLVPILDSVFILIFFLLVTSSFINLFQISSPVPIVSDTVSSNQDPLALTLSISKNKVEIQTGIQSKTIKTFYKREGNFNFEKMNSFFLELKRKHPKEKLAIFEPQKGVKYEEIIKLMDSVRMDKTDNKELFNEVVFGNLMSK